MLKNCVRSICLKSKTNKRFSQENGMIQTLHGDKWEMLLLLLSLLATASQRGPISSQLRLDPSSFASRFSLPVLDWFVEHIRTAFCVQSICSAEGQLQCRAKASSARREVNEAFKM